MCMLQKSLTLLLITTTESVKRKTQTRKCELIILVKINQKRDGTCRYSNQLIVSVYYLSCRTQKQHLSICCVQLIFYSDKSIYTNICLVYDSFFSKNYDIMIDLIKCHEKSNIFFFTAMEQKKDQIKSIKKKKEI